MGVCCVAWVLILRDAIPELGTKRYNGLEAGNIFEFSDKMSTSKVGKVTCSTLKSVISRGSLADASDIERKIKNEKTNM